MRSKAIQGMFWCAAALARIGLALATVGAVADEAVGREDLTPLVGRIVPVEPLLSEVDADTGFIRFMANVPTNGCEIVATVGGRPLGPIAEGRHVVDVKLVETATGKVRCENSYPFIARRRQAVRAVGRKLNNFVTEVVNTELKDGVYTFENPRVGQVFIGFDKPYEKAKAYLDGIHEPVVL